MATKVGDKVKVKGLRKEHRQRWRTLTLGYVEGDSIDKVLNKLKAKTSGTKVSILRNALLCYSVFLEQAEK